MFDILSWRSCQQYSKSLLPMNVFRIEKLETLLEYKLLIKPNNGTLEEEFLCVDFFSC